MDYMYIYDITEYNIGQERLNILEEDCIWWISAYRTKAHRLLLKVRVDLWLYEREIMNEFINRCIINGKLNTIKPSCKEKFYNFIMETMKPERVYKDVIERALRKKDI